VKRDLHQANISVVTWLIKHNVEGSGLMYGMKVLTNSNIVINVTN